MHIIVPIKSLSKAKTRLSGFLSVSQRQSLARAMAVSVLETLAKVNGIDSVTIASSDQGFRPIADRLGFAIQKDGGAGTGLNSAIQHSVDHLVETDAGDIGIVVSDLPLFNKDAFERVLRHHREGAPRQMTIVTDFAGCGTNIRLCRPGNLVSASYGKQSASRHQEAALKAGAEVSVIAEPTLALDIDNPEDIKSLLASHQKKTGREIKPVTMLAGWLEESVQCV